jgi:protein gp37
MSANTSIEWTQRTWNPVRGCSVVSPGCVNCYAMKMAHRFSKPGMPFSGLTKQTAAGPQWSGVVRTIGEALLEPLAWRKPQRIFVNSMSDLFHEDVADTFLHEVFATMALAPQHTFQILTKRADRMRRWLSRPSAAEDVAVTVFKRSGGRLRDAERSTRQALAVWPLPNVWLGVSVEDQQRADERIPLLLETPAAVRFISAEPLLGPVDLLSIPRAGQFHDYLTGEYQCHDIEKRCTNRLDWVIVGGESGPGARGCRVAWVRDIVAQCRAAGVPVFVKQLGAKPEGDPRPSDRIDAVSGTRTLTVMQQVEIRNRKGGDMAEWPDDLRVREFPR